MDWVLHKVFNFQICMYSFVYVFFMFFFIEKPEIFPTPAAEAPLPVLNYLDGFSMMFSNRNYGYVVLIFAIKQGTLSGFGMLITNILSPFGFTPSDLARIGLIFLVGGLVGGLCVTIIIDRTQAYKTTIIILALGCIGSTYGIISFLEDIESFALLFFMISNAFFSVGFLPVCLNLGIELTFPALPGLVTSSMMILTQIAIFLIGLLFNFTLQISPELQATMTEEELNLAQRDNSYLVSWEMLWVLVICLILAFFIKEDLRRLAFEQAKKAKESGEKEELEMNNPQSSNQPDTKSLENTGI